MSKRSPAAAGETERYMQRLADGLDALRPGERAEVLAEIRGHIADATVEAGGDETNALAAFGDPDEMATRILQERGMVNEDRGVRSAPAWMRWTAVGIDVGSWLVLLCFLLVPFGVLSSVGGVATAAAWAYVAVVAAGTVWWWGWKRRRRGYTTAGMSIMGLRRVRVAGTTRLLQAADLGEPRRGQGELAGSIAWAVVILLVVAAIAYGAIAGAAQNSAANRQNEVQNVARDVLDAERAIDQVYGAALKGESAPDWFAPQAASAGAELVARHAAGGFDAYSVDSIDLPAYKPMPLDSDELAHYTQVALVDVTEIRNDTGLATYEFRVVKRITDLQVSGNAMAFSGTWRIEKVTRLSDGSGA